MSALTLQMFGVTAAGQRLSLTDAEESDDFAAAMARADAVGFAAKDGLSDEVSLPDPALLVAPQMILAGRIPSPTMPERPQVQIVEMAGPEAVASGNPVAEPPAVPPGQPQGAELGSQPDDLPAAAVPSQALPHEVLPTAAGLPPFTLPGRAPSANTPALPAAALSHAMPLPEPQKRRLAANQIAELPMDVIGLQDRPVAPRQAFARSLPDMSVSTAAPPKWRASGQADLSAVPVSDVETDAPAQQFQGDGAHLQEMQAAPTLAKTAAPALAKVIAMPGAIVAPGAGMVDLPQRNTDSLMPQPAPDHPPLPLRQAQAVAALVQVRSVTQDPPSAFDRVTPMPQPAARSEVAQPIPLGKMSVAVQNPPIAPEATTADQPPETTPDDANLPEVMPIGAQKPAQPVQSIAVSSAESAWQTRLQVLHQPEAMRQVVQPALLPDPTLPQSGAVAIMPAILPDDALALLPPGPLPRATAAEMPAPDLSRTAEALHLVKSKVVGDPAEARLTLTDARLDAAFFSSLATPRPTIRPLPDEAAIPLALPTVLAPKLAAQIVPQAQRAEAGPVEVLLTPEDLGSVRFQIHQQADSVRVVLSVERPETLELVRRHADQLIQEFRQAGFSGATLSFGSWSQQGGQPDTPPQPPAMPQPDDQFFVTPAAARAATPSAAQYGGQGLNLRL